MAHHVWRSTIARRVHLFTNVAHMPSVPQLAQAPTCANASNFTLATVVSVQKSWPATLGMAAVTAMLSAVVLGWEQMTASAILVLVAMAKGAPRSISASEMPKCAHVMLKMACAQ